MSSVYHSIALAHLERNPYLAADVLERRDPAEVAGFLRSVPASVSATAIASLSSKSASDCFACLPLDYRSSVIAELSVPAAAVILRRLAPAARQEALGSLPAASRQPLERALSYPAESAGALADPAAQTLQATATVEQSVATIRASGGPVDALIFVLDRHGRAVGSVTPGALLAADPSEVVNSLDHYPARPVPATAHAPSLVRDDAPGGLVAVVDSSGRFIGALRSNNLRRGARYSPTHAVAALSELYWVALCEAWGGLSSGPRLTGEPVEVRHAG